MKALILMTRVPVPGMTKTRLMDVFTAEECTALHKCFLKDIFSCFDKLKDKVDIFLTHTDEGDIEIIKNIIPGYIKLFPQEGHGLGEKMMNSINHVLNLGYSEVILIGSDIPQVQPSHLMEAFDVLKENDIVIGPTFDGGYYLVGMHRLCREIFNDNLKWGNKSVLEGTLDIANKTGVKTGLAEKLMDIDTRTDLEEFMEYVEKNKEFMEKFPGNTVDFVNECWRKSDYVERYAGK